MKQFDKLSNAAAGDLWNDLKTLFVEKLQADGQEQITLNLAELQELLANRFGKEFKVTDLVQLLRNGFEQRDGQFIFKLSDFTAYQADRDKERQAGL